MKKLIFVVLFNVLMAFTFGQTNVYHPFPESNAVWAQSLWYLDGVYCDVSDAYNLYISGDTTIGSYTCHKLYKNGYMSEFCSPPQPPWPPYYYYGEYWGAFRQDSLNRKVYLNIEGLDDLAYDFNLNVGDTLPPSVFYMDGNYVSSIDSVLVSNHYNKRFWLSYGSHNNYVALIEGIGSTYGVFAYLAPPFESGGELSCVKINDQTAFSMDSSGSCIMLSLENQENIRDCISVSPNPLASSAILRVNRDLTNGILAIFNLLGQEVKTMRNISGQLIKLQRENLPAGVYFVRLSEENKIVASCKLMISD